MLTGGIQVNKRELQLELGTAINLFTIKSELELELELELKLKPIYYTLFQTNKITI